jgi:surface polysaccharide O-acyltransferase-like enzyme
MTAVVDIPESRVSPQVPTATRDSGIDTVRGIAILMVIGIHSLPQPLDTSWEKLLDAALRPCVPIFLFASGYLTAASGRVPLWKRVKATVIPYAIAFAVAYIYMARHNPTMDHRLTTTIARFLLAYVFVYYYVFIYIGCTIGLWLIFRYTGNAQNSPQRLVILLGIAIAFGLISGCYLDPLLSRTGFSQSFIQEVRLRDIPFWFSFAACGALLGALRSAPALRSMHAIILSSTLFAYFIYAAVRIFGIGDAADYDSVAFFGYATLLIILLLAIYPRIPLLAEIGSGSYFIYLWHIFVIMALRDHASLRGFGSVSAFVATYTITALVSITVLFAVRRVAPSRTLRWLGA